MSVDPPAAVANRQQSTVTRSGPRGFLWQHRSVWLWTSAALVAVGAVVIAVPQGGDWTPYVRLAAWGVGVPSFLWRMAESALDGLGTAWEKHGEELAGMILRSEQRQDHALAEVLAERTTSLTLARFVPSDRLRTIVSDLCGPVVERALDLQGNHPVIKCLDIRLDVLRIEYRDSSWNECGEADWAWKLAVVKRSIAWDVIAPGTSLTLGSVFEPTFVCLDKVLAHEQLRNLDERGPDYLLPLPWTWLDGDAPRGSFWLPKTDIVLPQLTVHGESIVPESPQHIEAELQSYPQWQEFHLKEELDALFANCLCFWRVTEPNKEIYLRDNYGNEGLHMEAESTYRVCVRGRKEGQILYRYQIPFLRPTFVEKIEFRLSERVAEEWILDPPSQSCAFQLHDHAVPDNEREQSLRWEGNSGRGTPFLPGHAVTFLWRERKSSAT